MTGVGIKFLASRKQEYGGFQHVRSRSELATREKKSGKSVRNVLQSV